MTSDVQMQNFMTDVTDAILMGENIDHLYARYNVSRREAEEWVELVRDLQTTLPQVEPTAQFSKRLKADLLGQQQAGMLGHLRRLPARVQWAAFAALLGGFTILVRRVLLGEDKQQDDPALREKA